MRQGTVLSNMDDILFTGHCIAFTDCSFIVVEVTSSKSSAATMLSSQTPLFSKNSVIATIINPSSERQGDTGSSYICMPSLSYSCAAATA